MSKSTQIEIEELIRLLNDQEPPFSSLGTPFLVDNEVTGALVKIGARGVPTFIKALQNKQPKIIMYVAYCLGQIGDSSAVSALHKTRQKYLTKEPKEELDFGVVSACTQAIERLQDK
jgi:HEAT repeat protein